MNLETRPWPPERVHPPAGVGHCRLRLPDGGPGMAHARLRVGHGEPTAPAPARRAFTSACRSSSVGDPLTGRVGRDPGQPHASRLHFSERQRVRAAWGGHGPRGRPRPPADPRSPSGGPYRRGRQRYRRDALGGPSTDTTWSR